MTLSRLHDADLTPLNTLAVNSVASYLSIVETLDDMRAWQRQREPGEAFAVLGGGSNVVLADRVETPLLLMRLLGRDIRVLSEREALVTAGAGENWNDFVEWTLANGWCGLENLVLIPGTVGASPIQNIGAYGVEMCQHFESLQAMDADSGELHTMTAADCRFSYRHSVFKEEAGIRLVVVSVTFRLSRDAELMLDYGDIRAELARRGVSQPVARDVAEAVSAVRRSKLPDPAELPNAGSFFKNPVIEAEAFNRLQASFPGVVHYPAPNGCHKIAAGWLIDQAGWRGRSIGPVQVNEKQALVLINQGGSGTDVLDAARIIAADVLERYGVTIEMEPRVIR